MYSFNSKKKYEKKALYISEHTIIVTIPLNKEF